MDRAGLPPALLLAAALLAGCRTGDPDSLEERYAVPRDPEADWEPDPGSPSYGETESGDRGPKSTRVTLGAWGMDGRLQGDAEGAPSGHGMDVRAIPGFSLEARFHSRSADDGSWSASGILLEHFRSAEDKDVRGGEARTEGALTAAWIFGSFVGEPCRGSGDVPQDFTHRFDLMLGLRRGFVQAEVPDGFGGTFRESSTWGELAVGLRAEVSPVRRVFLFARADGGSESDLFGSNENETGGDSAVGATSWQAMAGVRIRPVDHVSLLFGWRVLRLDGAEILNGGTEDVDTARATWSGPWAGLEVDF